MVFSSTAFLFFIFPLFFLGDRLSKLWGQAKWRNIALLAISLIFYTWGEAVNLFLLLFLGILNYYGTLSLSRSSRPQIITIILVTADLAVLAVFKYSPWIWSILFPHHPIRALSLPLGISFFTFHAVSYVLDVYRKDIQAAPDLSHFLTYFCMFPHLVAGPIVRYGHINQELDQRADDRDMLFFGVYRFILGINKKILIANTVAPLADAAFINAQPLSQADAWLGIIAYSIQIYFDFSAYSDMAIGLAAIAGFRFRENFLRPYSAISIRDFWRRWHISLSSWLRDYLYIPLGGSRSGRGRTYFNLILVFFLCGLWHGADFTFILWGLWHGLFLIIERLGAGRLLEKLPTFCGRFYTMLAVVIGWVFFRAENSGQAFNYLSVMFNSDLETGLSLDYFNRAILGVILGSIFCLLPDRFLPKADSRHPGDFSSAGMFIQILLMGPSLLFIISGSRNPFLYFNF